MRLESECLILFNLGTVFRTHSQIEQVCVVVAIFLINFLNLNLKNIYTVILKSFEAFYRSICLLNHIKNHTI
jgi:hypothetical protein